MQATKKSIYLGTNAVAKTLPFIFKSRVPILNRTVFGGIETVSNTIKQIKKTCVKLNKIHTNLKEFENIQKGDKEIKKHEKSGKLFFKLLKFLHV